MLVNFCVWMHCLLASESLTGCQTVMYCLLAANGAVKRTKGSCSRIGSTAAAVAASRDAADCCCLWNDSWDCGAARDASGKLLSGAATTVAAVVQPALLRQNTQHAKARTSYTIVTCD